MKPIETPLTDVTYGGVASKGIGDLPTQTILETLPDRSIVQVHRSTWELEPEERAAIMLGAPFVLDVYGGAVPPMRLAVAEPTLTDPETVYALVDQAIALSVGTTISSVLRSVGIDRDAATVAGWSDDAKKAVGEWLRSFEDGTVVDVPDVVELTDDEAETIQSARVALAPKEATDG